MNKIKNISRDHDPILSEFIIPICDKKNLKLLLDKSDTPGEYLESLDYDKNIFKIRDYNLLGEYRYLLKFLTNPLSMTNIQTTHSVFKKVKESSYEFIFDRIPLIPVPVKEINIEMELLLNNHYQKYITNLRESNILIITYLSDIYYTENDYKIYQQNYDISDIIKNLKNISKYIYITNIFESYDDITDNYKVLSRNKYYFKNIYSYSGLIDYLKINNNKKYDLIINDPIVYQLANYTNNWYMEEAVYSQGYFSYIVAALTLLNKGGCFVIKIRTIHTKITADLIYILSCYFNKVKLLTSDFKTSGYCYCENFNGISKLELNKFYDILKEWEKYEPSIGNNIYLNKNSLTKIVKYNLSNYDNKKNYNTYFVKSIINNNETSKIYNSISKYNRNYFRVEYSIIKNAYEQKEILDKLNQDEKDIHIRLLIKKNINSAIMFCKKHNFPINEYYTNYKNKIPKINEFIKKFIKKSNKQIIKNSEYTGEYINIVNYEMIFKTFDITKDKTIINYNGTNNLLNIYFSKKFKNVKSYILDSKEYYKLKENKVKNIEYINKSFIASINDVNADIFSIYGNQYKKNSKDIYIEYIDLLSLVNRLSDSMSYLLLNLPSELNWVETNKNALIYPKSNIVLLKKNNRDLILINTNLRIGVTNWNYFRTLWDDIIYRNKLLMLLNKSIKTDELLKLSKYLNRNFSSNKQFNDTNIFKYIQKINSTNLSIGTYRNDPNNKKKIAKIKANSIYKILKKYINISKKKKYLDIGSGTGELTLAVGNKLKLDINNIFGIDLNSFYGTEYEQSSFNFKVYDGKNIPYPDNSFDFITSFQVLHHIKDINYTIKELSRVLKKGGYFMIKEHNSITNNMSNLIDIEHMLYMIYEDKQICYKNLYNYYAEYKSREEWELLITSNGFKYIKVLDNDLPASLTNLTKNPTAYYFDIFQKI